MRLINMIFLPSLAAAIGVMTIFLGPWIAWKWMGVNDVICFGLFCLELVATFAGVCLLHERWSVEGQQKWEQG